MTDAQTGHEGFLGVIVLDTHFPRPPGDIGCLDTYARAGIPARLLTVPGASARRVVQTQDPALQGPFVVAARVLAAQGARLITTSLLQCANLPSPGIVTFDAVSLHHGLLQRAGVPDGTPVEGLTPGCELQSRILADDTVLDLVQAQEDVVSAAVRLVSRCPQVQTVVLECTNMPPYRSAVEQATGRPVLDLETLLLATWRRVQSSSTRRAG